MQSSVRRGDDRHPRAREHRARLRPLARWAGRRVRPAGTALGGARRSPPAHPARESPLRRIPSPTSRSLK